MPDVVLRARDDSTGIPDSQLYRGIGRDVIVRLYPSDTGRDVYDVQLRAANLVIADVLGTTGVGSSTGTASALGIGAGIWASTATSAGIGAASALGSALFDAIATATGTSTVTGVAGSSGLGVGASSGTATATAVGGSLSAATGAANGTGAATGVTLLLYSGIASASGAATAFGTGKSTVESVGTSTGTGAAMGSSDGFPAQFSGLRVYYGAAVHDLCLVTAASAPAGMGGVIEIYKNGTYYAAYLVEIADSNASPIRVKTSTGIKAVRIKT